MKKFLIIPIIFSFLLPQIVSAQVGGAPLSIESIKVTSEASEVNAKFNLQNNKDVFVDQLEYRIQFFKGDSLATIGDIFSGLEYLYTQTGDLDPLNPNESKDVDISFNVPAGLETGSYFARILVENNIGDAFGINYTKSSFMIEGTSDISFVGSLNAYVGTPEGLTSIGVGLKVSPEDKITIEIPLDENESFESVLEGEDISSKVSVHSISTGELISEGEKNIIEVSDGAVSILVPNGEDNKPGAYDVLVELTDKDGNKVANDIRARWFIEGLSVRIVSTDTNTNFYQKSSSADLQTVVSVGGHRAGEEITVKALFNFKKGSEPIVLSETYPLVHDDGTEEQLFIDFSNQEIGYKGYVDRVDVIITNSNGEELAKTSVELSTDETFGDPVDNNIIGLISTILILVGIVIIVSIIRKMRPDLAEDRLDPSVGIAILVVSSSLIVGGLVINPSTSQAGHGTEEVLQSSINIFSNNGLPSGVIGNTCDQDIEIELYIKGKCPHCINDIDLIVGLFDEYTGQEFDEAPTVITVDVDRYTTVQVIDPNNLITAGDFGEGTYVGEAGSRIYGPFVYKFKVNPSGVVNNNRISQSYSLWGKSVPDQGFSYCVASEQKIVNTVSCSTDSYVSYQAPDSFCVGDLGDIQIGETATIGVASDIDRVNIRHTLTGSNLPGSASTNESVGYNFKTTTSTFDVEEEKEYYINVKVEELKGVATGQPEVVLSTQTETCSLNGVTKTSVVPNLVCSESSKGTNSSPTPPGTFLFGTNLNFSSVTEETWLQDELGNNVSEVTNIVWNMVPGSESWSIDSSWPEPRIPGYVGSAYVTYKTTAKGLHVANVSATLKSGQVLSTTCYIYMTDADFTGGDLCLNLPGDPSSIPAGYEDINGDFNCTEKKPDISCSGDPFTLRLETGDSIDWDVVVRSQGNGGLTYSWSGSSGASGSGSSVTTTHSSTGDVTSSVTATDSLGKTDTTSCQVTITEDLCTNLSGNSIPEGYEDLDGDKICTWAYVSSCALPEVEDVCGVCCAVGSQSNSKGICTLCTGGICSQTCGSGENFDTKEF